VLERFFSLAKNRAAAFGPQYVELCLPRDRDGNQVGTIHLSRIPRP
jgi:hypothetical protein